MWAYGGWCCRGASLSPACRSICKACLCTGLGRPFIYGILQNVAFAVLVQDGHNSFQKTKNALYNPVSSPCPLFLWNSSVLGAHSAKNFTSWAVPKTSMVVSGLFSIILNSLALCGLASAHRGQETQGVWGDKEDGGVSLFLNQIIDFAPAHFAPTAAPTQPVF